MLALRLRHDDRLRLEAALCEELIQQLRNLESWQLLDEILVRQQDDIAAAPRECVRQRLQQLLAFAPGPASIQCFAEMLMAQMPFATGRLRREVRIKNSGLVQFGSG